MWKTRTSRWLIPDDKSSFYISSRRGGCSWANTPDLSPLSFLLSLSIPCSGMANGVRIELNIKKACGINEQPNEIIHYVIPSYGGSKLSVDG